MQTIWRTDCTCPQSSSTDRVNQNLKKPSSKLTLSININSGLQLLAFYGICGHIIIWTTITQVKLISVQTMFRRCHQVLLCWVGKPFESWKSRCIRGKHKPLVEARREERTGSDTSTILLSADPSGWNFTPSKNNLPRCEIIWSDHAHRRDNTSDELYRRLSLCKAALMTSTVTSEACATAWSRDVIRRCTDCDWIVDHLPS